MRKLTIFLLLLAACHTDTKPEVDASVLPRAVRNVHRNCWAVQTRIGWPYYPGPFSYHGADHKEVLYFGQWGPITSNMIGLGLEYTYPDSASAMRSYHSWQTEQDSMRRRAEIASKREDSIFISDHTYTH